MGSSRVRLTSRYSDPDHAGGFRSHDRLHYSTGSPSLVVRSLEELPLHRTEDVLSTLGMVRQHKLDVRTVTMGVDLHPCASPDIEVLCSRIRDRLLRYAGRLASVCREVEARYGIPIVNRRISVSPIAGVAASHSAE